jgi:putative sigma-54 modulation protein
MKVQVRGKGVQVTDALREYADRKVNKLTNHFASLTGATVTESIQGKQHRVEVQLEGDGIKLRGEEHGDDMYAAIDRVVDKLERQMQKYKGRSQRNGHPHHHHYGHHGEVVSPRTAPVEIEGIEDDAPQTGRIVRHKRFAIKPVSPQEAVEQMELLDHDFFVFENAQTGEVNVLYRREDENYGILEPER